MTVITLNDGQYMPAYVAEPSASPSPGLVLIQEIFGVNETMRDIANAYARKGFYVVRPDLFWREQPGIELDAEKEADRRRAFALYESLDEGLGGTYFLQGCCVGLYTGLALSRRSVLGHHENATNAEQSNR